MPALLTRISSEPNLALRVRHHGDDLRGLGHIGAVVERLDIEILFDLCALRLDGGGIAHPVDHDVGARAGESASYGKPDPARGSRDEGVAFGERHEKTPWFDLIRAGGFKAYCNAIKKASLCSSWARLDRNFFIATTPRVALQPHPPCLGVVRGPVKVESRSRTAGR